MCRKLNAFFFIRFVGIFRLNWCVFRKAFFSWVRPYCFRRELLFPPSSISMSEEKSSRERIAISSRGNFEISSLLVQTSMLYIRFSTASKSLLRDSINIIFAFSSSSKWCHLTIYWNNFWRKWRFQTRAFLLESFSVLFFHSLLRFTDTARVFA